jgi:uncharacterized membrane protein
MATTDNVLVLAMFDTETAADEAVAALKAWDKANDQVKLGGIGVLVKDEFGEIKQHKVGPAQGRKGAGIGVVLGVVAAIPTGGLSLLSGIVGGAIAGGAVGSAFRKGFHDVSKADAEQISKELDAGHAAVGVLVRPDQTDVVMAKLTQFGGKAEKHEVSDEELREVGQATGATGQPTQPPQSSEQSAPPQA